MAWKYIFFIIAVLFISPGSSQQHECERACEEGDTRECHYDMNIELFTTMHSYLCRNCPETPADCYNPGCMTGVGCKRGVISINRQLPGPMINVCQGDTIIVRVTNSLATQTITIHWHGIHQRDTQCMDGVPMVTQYPIPPTGVYVYTFVAEQAGTHFYHSHSGFQKDDGMYGALIVRQPVGVDPNNYTYQEDRVTEHTFLIMDWTPRMTEEFYIDARMDEPPDYEITVNGRGQAVNCDDGDGNPTPRPVFYVAPNKTHRWRFISNGFGLCPIVVSVQDHNMLVIATDGQPVQPTPVGQFSMGSGERFDVVINANQTPGTYWIKFQGLQGCQVLNRTYQMAILRYEGRPNDEMPDAGLDNYDGAAGSGTLLNPSYITVPASDDTINMEELQGIEGLDYSILSREPDKTYFVTFDDKDVNVEGYNVTNFPDPLLMFNGSYIQLPMNNITYIPPRFPALMDLQDTNTYCNSKDPPYNNCSNTFCSCTQQDKARRNQIIRIVFFNNGGFNGSHPKHLHGYSFMITAVHRMPDTGTFDQLRRMIRNGEIPEKRDTPVLKDTVLVQRRTATIVRFRADNPGVWAMHCHISLHSEPGMLMLFKVGPLKDVKCRQFPEDYDIPLCGGYPRVQPSDYDQTPLFL